MTPNDIKVEVVPENTENVEPVPVTPESAAQAAPEMQLVEVEVVSKEAKGAEVSALAPSAQNDLPADPNSLNVLKLSKEYDFDGRPLKEIDLHLDRLTTRDLQKATRMLEMSGELNPLAIMPEFTIPFIIRLVSISSKLPVEFLNDLSYKDAMALKMRFLAFFGASD